MAYPNKTINEGSFGSFQAANAIALYQRVKLTTAAGSDQKPKIDVAAIGDRAVGVAMQPIAAGAFGTIKFLNSPGEQFGLCAGDITLGAAIYSAASGRVGVASGGGALLAGTATVTGADGGSVTYVPISATA
jgi:hypothetical protein